ncbi:hypothetical protein A3860_09965 [Niastella vici]|uniref:Six-hairpin glycosidase-like protein n=1 Tax=Niastella vici TaxID=1703345 RepID=A0A1V9FF34_9BACT|nr:hypothetical protein [Niastella vici]OQP56897.1 hypothetical protein A3860_09965 [Niastella vici]
MKQLMVLAFLLAGISLPAQQQYWQLTPDGGIRWTVQAGQVHADHIEMSGMQVSAIVRYGVDETGKMVFSRKLVFPMLRTIPNDTRGNLIKEFTDNITDSIIIGGRLVKGRPQWFYIRGILECTTLLEKGVSIQRKVFPSVDKAAFIEYYTIRNNNTDAVAVHIPETDKSEITDAASGVYGAYTINYKVYNGGPKTLNGNSELQFWVVISARKTFDEPYHYAARYEWEKRLALVDQLQDNLVLKTPNDTINCMFAFAKIRAAESIFDTKEGLMHGPGGGEYYAAIWANDQAEYINPFFAYLGYNNGIESARNSFRLFASYINPAFNPIPSSIIAEGAGYWNGAGDRGDQAMIGYGASFFALTCGDTSVATSLWSLIDWCNAYLLRKKSPEGVIASESDELEGRFPAGKINLSTNALAYASFRYGASLAAALGKSDKANDWKKEAEALKRNIGSYFGASVEGYNTYRYYEGNNKLRSWICLPLVMDIHDRKDQTRDALLSRHLWTTNGMLTQSGTTTFWDRSTLYGFRGLFRSGATDTTYPYFAYYSAQRLLGGHVPYAIEAWPEGNQRHLSAESGLYCRAIVEGLWGFDPVGFREFTISPKLPKGWEKMSLHKIHAFNTSLDITVYRVRGKYRVCLQEAGKPAKMVFWNGIKPLHFVL